MLLTQRHPRPDLSQTAAPEPPTAPDLATVRTLLDRLRTHLQTESATRRPTRVAASG